MERNEIVKVKARQVIEDYENRDITDIFITHEKLPTNYILCSLPVWMKTIDLVMDGSVCSREERIAEYYNNYFGDGLSEDDIHALVVDDCINSEFDIKSCWEFHGETVETFIGGNTKEELFENILKDFAEYENCLKECKNW